MPLAAGFIGSRFMPGDWYLSLAKPSWTPPGWIFGPVWTLLYILMGISAWLVWKEAGIWSAKLPLALFIMQLVLNALWSWLFFGLNKPGLALIDIVVLWTGILAVMLLFWQIRPLAGALFAPYLAWVTFAAALNLAIWLMNRN